MKARFVAAAFTLFSAASAQTTNKPPDPSDPAARVRPLAFASSIAVVRPDEAHDPAAQWRMHNEQVRDLGGHAGHARHAGSGEPASTRTPTTGGQKERR